MNCGTHHRYYLLRNNSHAVRRRNVISSIGQNLFFGLAMRFEIAPRNEIVTVKDFCHSVYPPRSKGLGSGWALGECWNR